MSKLYALWQSLSWCEATFCLGLIFLIVLVQISFSTREKRPFVSNREIARNSQDWSLPVVRAIFKALWGDKHG